MDGVEKGGSDVMLKHSIRRVLVSQCIVSLLLLLGILAFDGFFSEGFFGKGSAQDFFPLVTKLKASAYGAMLAITGTILSARSIRTKSIKTESVKTEKGERVSELGASALLPIYSGLLNKLVIVGGGIGFGLIALALEPIFVVSSYFIVQVAVAVPFRPDKGVGVG